MKRWVKFFVMNVSLSHNNNNNNNINEKVSEVLRDECVIVQQ